jgi:hypothetical protein
MGLFLFSLDQDVRGSEETRPIIDCPGEPLQRTSLPAGKVLQSPP